MSDFEREIAGCLNRFFRARHIPGFAYRTRHRALLDPPVDVLVDSPDPSYCFSLECKSIIDRKLYFSQHFHADKDKVHPVDAISAFLVKSGRIGFLAIEFRQDPVKAGEAFLIPWAMVAEHFRENRGITADDARLYIPLSRSREGYVLERLRDNK
jgi:hypothetical protein